MAPRIGEAIQPTAIAVWLQPAFERSLTLSREAAGIVAYALRPAALLALALGVWRLGIDLGWTQDFFIAGGLFSHWQVWLMLAGCMQASAGFLARASRGRDQ